VQRYRKKWLQSRIRRVIPGPETLFPRVYQVLITFGPLKCSSTRKPLFDHQAWKEAKNFLTLVAKGYLSEPEGQPLYHVRSIDSNGLKIYRCSRGTIVLEGGIHQNVIRRFGAFNASPKFACSLMTEYRTRHNLDVR